MAGMAVCVCGRLGAGVSVCGVMFLLWVFVACVGNCVATHPSPNMREREHERVMEVGKGGLPGCIYCMHLYYTLSAGANSGLLCILGMGICECFPHIEAFIYVCMKIFME